MGECHCSKIAIMQLFHELKQQFPALPDHIVSQCIAQNSHDREICVRSLRATQESRPPPGAFPPPPPQTDPVNATMSQEQPPSPAIRRRPPGTQRPPRPVSLDIGTSRRCQSAAHPSSAPAAYTASGFFEDFGNAVTTQASPSFEFNVNVACSPSGNHEFPGTNPTCEVTSAPSQQQTPITCEPTTRSFTSVSLTLRPPLSEPQPPIDISSQGSSLTYSSSSSHPRGFQSHLQISIGHGSAGSAAAARIKPPHVPQQRPNSLVTLVHNPSAARRPPVFAFKGLPVGPPSQLPRPTSTVSAPTTPSGLFQSVAAQPTSLPVTPLAAPSTSLGAIPRIPAANRIQRLELPPEYRAILDQVPNEYKELVTEQLIRKDRLAKALKEEKEKLEAINKKIEMLSKPPEKSPKEIERQLRSEIYQLQLACDKLTEEVDQQSGSHVPLGETNEEFYQGIYTGQQYVPRATARPQPPPLPIQPPAWEPAPSRVNNQEESDGPSWVCPRCTFDNHPLMNKCEECDMPRFIEGSQGETQDIHIRVTHHHNFPPGRTVHNWVV